MFERSVYQGSLSWSRMYHRNLTSRQTRFLLSRMSGWSNPSRGGSRPHCQNGSRWTTWSGMDTSACSKRRQHSILSAEWRFRPLRTRGSKAQSSTPSPGHRGLIGLDITTMNGLRTPHQAHGAAGRLDPSKDQMTSCEVSQDRIAKVPLRIKPASSESSDGSCMRPLAASLLTKPDSCGSYFFRAARSRRPRQIWDSHRRGLPVCSVRPWMTSIAPWPEIGKLSFVG